MPDLTVLIAGIAAGSALGGVARFFVSGVIARAVGETFPWGTLAVNASGALVIGVAAGAVRSGSLSWLGHAPLWQTVVTGFLGSYTTVSSFSLQTLTLLNDGIWLKAAGNVVLSLLLCLAAVALGYLAGSAGASW